MSTYQRLYYPTHEVQSNRDDHRAIPRGRAYSSSDPSAKLSSTDTHPQSKISRSQICKTPVRSKQSIASDDVDGTLFTSRNEHGAPSTPVPVPSLSSSEDISPQSSRRLSPVTPTFVDNRSEDHALIYSSSVKSHPFKPGRDFEKRDISYPMSNPAYSTIPLTLDIRVDRDAYEPRREPPRPVDPLPQELETSYLEWDESSSRIDKMKRSMRLVSHGHRKQATPITTNTLPHRSRDNYFNATPRTSQHSRHVPVPVDRHQHQVQPSHVSNFSRPNFQASAHMQNWSKQSESERNQTALSHMCDWQEFLRSSTPSQEVHHTQKPSTSVQMVKDKHKNGILSSQKSASVSRHVTSPSLSVTGKADADTKTEGQQPLAKLKTEMRSFATHDDDPHPQAPSFYTYHVTRRMDLTNVALSSYTQPQTDGSLSFSPSREPTIDLLKLSSCHTDNEPVPTKTRRFKNLVQGITKKPSMSNLRRRGTHSGAQR